MILRTEQESLAFVQNYHPALKTMQNKDFQLLRQSLRETEPDIYHDVTEWRRRAVEQAMLNAGLSAQDAAVGAEAAMENFAKWRSRIDVPQETHDTLAKLAENGRWSPSPMAMRSRSCLVWGLLRICAAGGSARALEAV